MQVATVKGERLTISYDSCGKCSPCDLVCYACGFIKLGNLVDAFLQQYQVIKTSGINPAGIITSLNVDRNQIQINCLRQRGIDNEPCGIALISEVPQKPCQKPKSHPVIPIDYPSLV